MYSTKADQYGHWSIELQKELPDDTYTYTVTVNKGDKMNYISDKITIDTVALPTHINPSMTLIVIFITIVTTQIPINLHLPEFQNHTRKLF